MQGNRNIFDSKIKNGDLISKDENMKELFVFGKIGNIFYINILANILIFLNEMFKCKNNTELQKNILYGKYQGINGILPLLGLCILSSKSCDLFKQTIHLMTTNANDWIQFLNICNMHEIKEKRIRNGVGRTIKTQIHVFLQNNRQKAPDFSREMNAVIDNYLSN